MTDKKAMKSAYKTDDKHWVEPINNHLKGNVTRIMFKKLSEDAKIPICKTKGDAGFDVSSSENTTIPAKKSALVSTGFALGIPLGYEAQVRPRSGLAAKYMVTVLNAPGTIDAGYRGEVKVVLINHSDKDFVINKGDRIAQLVFKRVEECSLYEVDNLDETERGSGGFGSTGVK